MFLVHTVMPKYIRQMLRKIEEMAHRNILTVVFLSVILLGMVALVPKLLM